MRAGDEEARAARIVAAARALVGVPFRLHGLDPATGVDCVGLVVLALEAGGGGAAVRAAAPRRYCRRGGRAAAWAARLAAAGLRPAATARAGDVVLVWAGAAQFHLMLTTGTGAATAHVHAHAGLGRVVEMPGASPWPVVGRWRLADGAGE